MKMQINEDSALQTMGRTHAGVGEKREEERAEERSCYGLTATSQPHPPAPLGVGRGVRDSGMKN